MHLRNELTELIEQIPEKEIPKAILLLKRLIEKQKGGKSIAASLDPLDTFMATVVHSLTNAMYDLSADARRKEENIMANRLEVYRKKVSEGWEKYKDRKEIAGE